MCCFSGPVQSVSATRIFARLLDPGVQALAYRMRFEAGEPFCHLLPLQRALLEQVQARWRPISETPDLADQHQRWTASRGHFLQELPDPESAAAREQWQRGYFRGVDLHGCPAKEHRVKLRLPGFTRASATDDD